MILYTLRCANGHDFEAWFRNSATCDEQVEAGVVACPSCEDTDVTKAVMAPRLAAGGGDRDAPAGGSEAEPPAVTAAPQTGLPAAKELARLRRYVKDNCEHVGERFADEARKIHYGEADERGIYGEATDADADSLAEEGIPFGRLPWPVKEDA